jgi:hypothetical protein
MKKYSLALVVALGLLVEGLVGCSTMSGSQKARVHTGITVAAYVGTVEALRPHPEYRIGFETAALELKALEDGKIDTIKLLEIVNRLPVKELKSDRAQMIISAATIVLADEIGSTPIEQLDNLKPVVSAIREGIERGLATR